MSFSTQRIAAGLTIDEISSAFRVPPARVWDWEEGKAQPPAHIARSLHLLKSYGEQLPSPEHVETPAAPVKLRATKHSGSELIKSKQRVADHGEVFTPPWLVEKMLDLVKGESERIDSRFLEPACGSGNFLVAVLKRKLAAVEAKYGRQPFNRKLWALQALACCYGIELLEDNITECRDNMLAVFANYLRTGENDEFYRAARHILSLNLIQGDAMKMTRPDGSPIMIVEWAHLKAGRFNRRDFRLEVLTRRSGFDERWATPDTEQEVTLFGEPRPAFHHRGRDEIFQPIRDYPPMSVREMAAMDGADA